MKDVGIDIVEIERVEKALSDSFLRKVLSASELERTKTMKPFRLVEFVAGRFAAKEAIIKCLSDYDSPVMSELDITNNENGKPEIHYKDYKILLSISHEKTYAVAIAMLEGEE